MPKQAKPDLSRISPDLRPLAVPISTLTMDTANPKGHGSDQVQTLVYSLKEFGMRRPLVVNRNGMVIEAGNGVLEAAIQLGMTHVPVVHEDDSHEKARAYSIMDNRSSELSDWTPEHAKLIKELKGTEHDVIRMGLYAPGEVRQILDDYEPDDAEPRAEFPKMGTIQEIDKPEAPTQPITQPGWVWRLDDHRVGCGDSKDETFVRSLFGTKRPQVALFDPPYCSGGFQESGKSRGSFPESGEGNVAADVIASDNLSTRGYQALISNVLSACKVPTVYICTDWRMWIPLFDTVEGNALAIRAMIVWDKGHPGLGGMWRGQHELIMFATRHSKSRQPGAPTGGNVIQCKRTGNKHHYTEKPVELFAKILHEDAMSGRKGPVFDPFMGSGTTILACEQMDRKGIGCEIDPKHVDVAVRRWVELTRRTATAYIGTKKVGELAPK